MSKKVTTRNVKSRTSEVQLPLKQKLTGNFKTTSKNGGKVSLEKKINAKRSTSYGPKSTINKELSNDSFLAFERCNTEDDIENETNCARPEVLSIDSDFSSGNATTDSPDQESITEITMTDHTLFPTSSDVRLEYGKKYPHEDSPGVNVKNFDLTNYSYCTPPRVLDREKEISLGKKGTLPEEGKPFSQMPSHYSVPGLVTSDHNQRTQVLYGRPANNELDSASSNAFPPFAVGYGQARSLAEKQQEGEAYKAQGGEDMDMRYTDITHMQLKRSLDLIHGQNSTRSVSSSTSLPSSTYSDNGLCYSNPTVRNSHLTCSSLGGLHSHRGTVTDDYRSSNYPHFGHSTSAQQSNYYSSVYTNGNGSVAASQSTKFDAILQVKDAMLQEKESIILKLRLQMASMQHQVKEGEAALRQIVKTKMANPQFSSSSIPNYSGNQNLDLEAQKKIHDLGQLLGKAECNLLENSSRYETEKKEAKERIDKLETSLKKKEHANADLKKKQKSATERYEKCKKRVECLERYLGDLPTIEENNLLKTEAGILGEERETLVVEIAMLKTKLEDKVKLIKDKEMQFKQLKENMNEQSLKIERLQEGLTKSEKSKLELGPNERDHLEDLKFEVNRLQKEKDDAALVVSGCEKRIKQQQEKHRQEVAKLQEKLQDAEDLAEERRRDLFMKQQTSNKAHTAMKNLSLQNQQLLDQKLNLQDRVKNLEKLHSNMQEASQACLRLQRETNCAVLDLKAVTQVLIQTAKGADPNISALLGVRSDSIGGEEDVFGQAESSIGDDGQSRIETGLSVDLTNKRLAEVRQLRKEVDELRTMLSNQYAESIGNNCITQ